MKNKVMSFKTDEDIRKKIRARDKALKRAGIGNTQDARYCMGLGCLCEQKGIKVKA
jgi:hypothetical protein